MPDSIPSQYTEEDGCALDFTVDPTGDLEVPYVILFADVLGDDEAIERRAQEYREIWGDR